MLALTGVLVGRTIACGHFAEAAMQATLLALLAGGGHALRVFSAARPALPRCGAPPVLVVRAREETIQQTIAGNEVVIYSKTWCPYCAQTKKLFDELQQPYTAIELDEREVSGA